MDNDRYSDDTSVASGDDFLPDAEVGMKQNLTEDGGVKKECVVAGEGTQRPPKGSTVRVSYVGSLEDGGMEFDRSEEPIEFELGAGTVIKGWDIGVATMRRGETSILTCAHEYAYGEAGRPPVIPSKATLKFEVELVSWIETKDVSEAKDGSIVKRILKMSDKWDRPAYEAACTVSIATVSAHDDATEKLQMDNAVVTLGDELVPWQLEQALESMAVGEEGEVTVTEGEGKQTVYKVTLHKFEPARSRWNLNLADQLAEAEKRKVQGNMWYKKQRLQNAVKKYEKGLEYISEEHDASEEDKKAVRPVHIALLTNLAAAQLFQKDYAAVVTRCTEALNIESSNAKALLRRAKAHTALDSWSAARIDLEKILENNAGDKEAIAEMAK
eukprot:gene15971-24439_t